jgi:hypothetical protein
MVKLRRIITAAFVATMAVGSIAAPATAKKPLIEITGHTRGVSAQVTIRCYGGISPVVLSGSTVLVNAEAYCDYEVPDINLTVELYRAGNLTGIPGFDAGISAVATGASTFCIDGGYYGKMIVNVLFPPNFVPQAGRAIRYSGAVNIDCP